jgi:purine-nucleoside phosphorylase
MYKQLMESVSALRKLGITMVPEVGIILGTGLGNLVTRMEKEAEVAYEAIPHFPVSTVEFHSGKLIFGMFGGKRVVVMQGRLHAYEGYSMQQIVIPVRVMKLLGIKKLLISNVAGGINPELKKGSFMLIDDHINLQLTNPLIGKNLDELGSRFPDMSRPYDASMMNLLEEEAGRLGISLARGVYAAVTGPNLETRAEYRFLRIIGADAVGMSTVPEVIAANHMGLPVAAVSIITDECDPDHLEPVNVQQIIEVATKAEIKLTELFKKCIERFTSAAASSP